MTSILEAKYGLLQVTERSHGILIRCISIAATKASRAPVTLLRLFLTLSLDMNTSRTRPHLTELTIPKKLCGAGSSIQATDHISFDSGQP